jgi:site-specific recombinase XerD
MSSQLFHVLPPMTIPYSGVKHKDGIHVTSQIIQAFPFMYWPSGKPCEPGNMYLLDIAHEVTGDSLRSYAAELSHLVRYCGKKLVSIESLTDADIHALSKQLQEEKSRRNPLERARNDNTVRAILSRAIRFFLWYQKNIMLLLRTPLIGEQSVSPQITVKRIKNDKSKTRNRQIEYYYTHSAMPTSESREPKRPIALTVIEDIQRSVNRQSVLEAQSARFVQRYRNDPALLAAQLEYMRARRHFMVWMMMHTGLRPSELVEMSVREHINILVTRILKLPTKKRRKIKAPIRSFPILLNAATVVHRYLIARTTYCKILQGAGGEPNLGDSFFLTLDGEPIKKSSLEKDFERLTVDAGYKDVQACLSMFRHRFITYEVTVHLKEFIENSGKSRQMMTDIDYESILKRVSAKTGHGSVQSLWHYIDLAWEELGVWGSIDKAIARLHAADQLFADLLALQHETETLGNRQGNRKIDLKQITDRLGDIISIAKQDIEVQELHGKHF